MAGSAPSSDSQPEGARERSTRATSEPLPEPSPVATRPQVPPADELERLLAQIEREPFTKLVLAKPRGPAVGDLLRVSIRPITLRGGPHLCFVSSHPTRDLTQNLPLAEGVAAVRELLQKRFSHAHLFTAAGEIQLLISKKGRQTLRHLPLASAVPGLDSAVSGPASTPPVATRHDRPKHRYVDIDRPFLKALGVTDAQGRLIPAMARKWKQINKFLEVVDHALASTPLKAAARIAVADFGSGKGYLTFALHDHLRHTLGLPAVVTGVELRRDLVDFCNQTAASLGLDGLMFEHGDVQTRAAEPQDILIALHACDTATDHAIHAGVRAGARVIVCSPCCHKELRPQLLSPHPLRPILKHGVHLGQQAEMLTDGLRAMLLDACGYDTQVFEFVALEHSHKNKMILAVRREPGVGNADAVWAQVGEIKAYYGIRDQCLETLLRRDRAA